jgi:hypothetical protein
LWPLGLSISDFRKCATGAGSVLVEDVEDAHHQLEHYHPQNEAGTTEGSISRMSGSSQQIHFNSQGFRASSPTTIVIQCDSEQYHLQNEDAAYSC